ncbi:MAG TPA: adenylosuccinate synthase [Bacteroidales bacterium]|nr:adenylosuccinate synthase [Bacteroidales bacterium]
MKADVLLGLQWGDEGKGKIVDFLAPDYDVIARFQGGPNAGHTLEFEGKKQILHTIPSGIFHQEKMNIIGNGVIIDPLVLEKEIVQLQLLGVEPASNLFISKRAHLILPTHLLLDAANEKSRADLKIGSTLKGIGPAYTDKTGRNGIRVGDIDSASFTSKYQESRKRHLALASLLYKDINEILLHGMSLNEYEERWMQSLKTLRTIKKIDSEYFINDCLLQGKRVLAEGAQGALLDLDFGSYPFVTSSNTIAAGVCSGLGLAPSSIGRVFGIFKAYCTRVGNGPFPTELFDEAGELLRKQGNEFGSTTGRPRRCGWLDLPALKYAVMLNGVTHLFMMKADVLNDIANLSVCNAYKTPAGEVNRLTWEVLEQDFEPLYVKMKGWQRSLNRFNSFDALPLELIEYISLIEKSCKVEISILSIGPDRTQTIVKSSFTVS